MSLKVYIETTIVSYLTARLNAEMQIGIGKMCRAAGYEPPVICTPEELLGS